MKIEDQKAIDEVLQFMAEHPQVLRFIADNPDLQDYVLGIAMQPIVPARPGDPQTCLQAAFVGLGGIAAYVEWLQENPGELRKLKEKVRKQKKQR